MRPLMKKLSKAVFAQSDEFEGSISQSTLMVLKEFAQIKGIEFNHELLERFFRSRHGFFEVNTGIRGAEDYQKIQYFADAYRILASERLPFGLVESFNLKWGVLKSAVLSAFEPLSAVELREIEKSGSQYSISFVCKVAGLSLVFDVYGSLGKAKRIWFSFNVIDQSGAIVATIPVGELFGDMHDVMVHCEDDAEALSKIYADRCDRIARYCQREWQ